MYLDLILLCNLCVLKQYYPIISIIARGQNIVNEMNYLQIEYESEI